MAVKAARCAEVGGPCQRSTAVYLSRLEAVPFVNPGNGDELQFGEKATC
jgi:hypothetical protein